MQFDVPSHINSAAAEEISKLNTSNVELHKRNDILSEQVSDEKPSSLKPSHCNDLPRLFKSEKFAPDYIYLLSYSVYLLEVMICCQCQVKRRQVILCETKSRSNYFSPLSLSTLPTSFLSAIRYPSIGHRLFDDGDYLYLLLLFRWRQFRSRQAHFETRFPLSSSIASRFFSIDAAQSETPSDLVSIN